MTAPPTPGVLAAFGIAEAEPHLLPGGQGAAWGAGEVVLKRAPNVVEAEWVASVLAELREDGFRISRPVVSLAETWTVQGWSAWQLVEGVHDFIGRWPEVLEAGQRFHRALAEVPEPGFLGQRDDAWSVGDRFAWNDEAPPVIHDELRQLVEDLAAFRKLCAVPSQVIHGDLTGNVLFAPDVAPAIIDFVPYFRPAAFAQAVVVADAIAWHRADPELIRRLPPDEDPSSMVARAAIYRLITADRGAVERASSKSSYLRTNLEAHRRILIALKESAVT